MWKICTFLLVMTYASTGTEYPLNPNGLSPQPGEFDDEIFLDESDWRLKDEELLSMMKSLDMQDCSYVEKITSANYNMGYMDVVASPTLKGYLWNLSQYIRIIISVPHQEGDVVRLYNGTDTTAKPIYETTLASNTSHVDTNTIYTAGENYTAVYFRKNGERVITSEFNNVKPSWMRCMKDVIRNRYIGKLFFPGTHDSGSYTSPNWWKYNIALVKYYYNFVFTQEDSILSQLMQGARSFDLRLAKYNTKDTFYINHGVFKVRPLIHVLQQIREFLTYNTEEIILLDFHNFPVGFSSESDHAELISFLRTELNYLMYWHPNSATWNVTFDDIWKTEARIIIAYNEDSIPEKYHLFPGVHQIWGNKDEVPELVQYMNENLPKNCNGAGNTMTSAMVELTPNAYGIIFKYPGLRYLASLTNSLVTKEFFLGPWGEAAQAVAVDFLGSTGIVGAAIRQNALRAQADRVCH